MYQHMCNSHMFTQGSLFEWFLMSRYQDGNVGKREDGSMSLADMHSMRVISLLYLASSQQHLTNVGQPGPELSVA